MRSSLAEPHGSKQHFVMTQQAARVYLQRLSMSSTFFALFRNARAPNDCPGGGSKKWQALVSK
jgi:hypothetical protein